MGWINECEFFPMHEWKNELINEWMDGWMSLMLANFKNNKKSYHWLMGRIFRKWDSSIKSISRLSIFPFQVLDTRACLRPKSSLTQSSYSHSRTPTSFPSLEAWDLIIDLFSCTLLFIFLKIVWKISVRRFHLKPFNILIFSPSFYRPQIISL